MTMMEYAWAGEKSADTFDKVPYTRSYNVGSVDNCYTCWHIFQVILKTKLFQTAAKINKRSWMDGQAINVVEQAGTLACSGVTTTRIISISVKYR